MQLDPADVMARYHLACAYARLDLPERAIALLDDLRGAGGEQCRERLRRAAADPDFTALRARADFRRAITGG